MHFTWMQTFCSCSLGKSIQSGIFTKEGLIAIVGIIINRHTWPACFWKEWSKFTEVTLTKISHSHVIMLPNWRASNNKKKPINHLFCLFTPRQKKRPLISDHIKGPLVATFRSPLMKALDRSVETLGLWIVTSSVTFIKSANQCSFKLCPIFFDLSHFWFQS